jgi:N-sulfoglucosamine sulfohydrolase
VLLTGLHNHLNGQYGHQHGYHNFHTKLSVRSLPVLLAEAGFRTGHVGKFHVQPEPVYHFETYLSGNPGGERNPVSMAEKVREFIAAKDQRPFSCISARVLRKNSYFHRCSAHAAVLLASIVGRIGINH